MILTHRIRAVVHAALVQAVARAEREQEVAITVRTTHDVRAVVRDIPIAALTVLDLETIPAAQALAVASEQLEAHPFTKIIVIPSLLPKITDQLCLFQFGRVGILDMPTPEHSQDPQWWVSTIEDTAGFDIVAQAQRDLRATVSNTPQGLLAIRYAQHATVSSVKLLADRLYPGTHHSPAYKRRKLWQECKVASVGSPENVLASVRLVLMKSMLDANVWTPDRVARYFGFDTARHLNRSCKTRYKRSLRDIRRLSRDDVLQLAKATFFSNHAAEE